MSKEKGKRAEPSPKMAGSVRSLIQPEENLKQLIRSAMTETINPLIARLNALDEKILICQDISSNNSKKIDQLETVTQQNKMDLRMANKNIRLLETQVMDLQLEKAKTILRIQNFPEGEEGSDLRSKMARLLMQLTEKSYEELYKEITAVYRAGSGFTKKHNLPREVFIHFSSVSTRNIILKNSGEELRYQDNTITIRKEVPFLVRKKRIKYRELTTLPLKKKIMYRYLIPEGLLFTFKDQHFRITTEEQMQTFLATHGKDLDFFPTQKEEGAETKTMKEQALMLQKLRPRIKHSQK